MTTNQGWNCQSALSQRNLPQTCVPASAKAQTAAHLRVQHTSVHRHAHTHTHTFTGTLILTRHSDRNTQKWCCLEYSPSHLFGCDIFHNFFFPRHLERRTYTHTHAAQYNTYTLKLDMTKSVINLHETGWCTKECNSPPQNNQCQGLYCCHKNGNIFKWLQDYLGSEQLKKSVFHVKENRPLKCCC